jgi:divalent metal cation (Fe/Co/Zn/Cd) transporter
VERIIHMKTLHLGPEELLVAAKIAVPGTELAEEVARHINETEERIRQAVPIARVIYLEPDIYHPEKAPKRGSATSGATRVHPDGSTGRSLNGVVPPGNQ